jgi:hypothetical protein
MSCMYGGPRQIKISSKALLVNNTRAATGPTPIGANHEHAFVAARSQDGDEPKGSQIERDPLLQSGAL